MKKDKLSERINKIVTTDENKCLLIMTLSGTSAILADHILNVYQNQMYKLPVKVAYCCALSAGNLLAIISDEEPIKSLDLSPDNDLNLNEQSQEDIFRRMKLVVEELYKYIQEKEKI